MNSKILLAVDGSDHSMQSAYYVANMLSNKHDVLVVFFTVLPVVPPTLPASKVLKSVSSRSEMVVSFGQKKMPLPDAEREVEKRLFGPMRETFRIAGFSDEQMTTKCFTALPGSNIAKEIEEECRKGEYDTVVIGRHWHSGIHELFLGNIAEKVIKRFRNCAVWVVA